MQKTRRSLRSGCFPKRSGIATRLCRGINKHCEDAPYNSIYCAFAAVIGTQWLCRTSESLVAEMKVTIQEYEKRDFCIIDDSINLNEQAGQKNLQPSP